LILGHGTDQPEVLRCFHLFFQENAEIARHNHSLPHSFLLFIQHRRTTRLTQSLYVKKQRNGMKRNTMLSTGRLEQFRPFLQNVQNYTPLYTDLFVDMAGYVFIFKPVLSGKSDNINISLLTNTNMESPFLNLWVSLESLMHSNSSAQIFHTSPLRPSQSIPQLFIFCSHGNKS
jgi:hypothetical protein